jgi:hypothetical protein
MSGIKLYPLPATYDDFPWAPGVLHEDPNNLLRQDVPKSKTAECSKEQMLEVTHTEGLRTAYNDPYQGGAECKPCS